MYKRKCKKKERERMDNSTGRTGILEESAPVVHIISFLKQYVGTAH